MKLCYYKIGKEGVIMKIFPRYATFTGYTIYHNERSRDWCCPNKKCKSKVSEGQTRCLKCGQRLKFKEQPKIRSIDISINIG